MKNILIVAFILGGYVVALRSNDRGLGIKTALLISIILAILALVLMPEAKADEWSEMRMQQQIDSLASQQRQLLKQQESAKYDNRLKLIYPGYPPAVQYRYGYEYDLMPWQLPGQPSYQYQLRRQ